MSWFSVIAAIALVFGIIYPGIIWDYFIRPNAKGGGDDPKYHEDPRYTDMRNLTTRQGMWIKLVSRLFFGALLIQQVGQTWHGYKDGQRLHKPYIIDRIINSPLIGLEILLPIIVFILAWNYVTRKYYPGERSWAFIITSASLGPIIIIYWIVLAH